MVEKKVDKPEVEAKEFPPVSQLSDKQLLNLTLRPEEEGMTKKVKKYLAEAETEFHKRKIKLKPIVSAKPSPLDIKDLISNIVEKLDILVEQAVEIYNTQVLGVFKGLRKSKDLMKRGGRYSLNPHRKGRLVPEEIPKSHRKQAREAVRKLEVEFTDLQTERLVTLAELKRVKGVSERTVKNVKEAVKAVKGLVQCAKDLESRRKLFSYQRRGELELYNKVFGKDSTKDHRKKKPRSRKGDIEMAKKNEPKIKALLAQLGKAKEQQKKREIRAELRSLGHRGGLGKGAGRPKKKVKKAKKKAAKKS